VQALASETSFGLPSGHAQNAVAIWGGLALWLKNRWGWVISGVIILLISLSRLYLGVHFPTDVLGGWILGGLLIWGYTVIEKPLIKRLKNTTVNDQVIFVLASSLVFAILGFGVRLALVGWSIPEGWAANAAVAFPEEEIDPLALSGLITSVGTLFGFATGHILMSARGSFEARGPWLKRGARLALGLAGALVLWMGLGEIFPRGEYLLAFLLRYLRYALVGLWVTYLAPVMFIKLKLTRPRY
jgi:hypothetical protein